jgi:hypothetical protein
MNIRQLSFSPSRALAAACVASALAGCAAPPAPTSAMLTYETQPDGATLYEDGKSIGQAPVTRTYPGAGAQPSIRTPLVTAVWPSGAKENFYTILPLGADRVATIARPANAPGLDKDQEHAKKLTANREQLARRRNDEVQRDQRRNSERCRQQQAGAGLAVQDDC